MFNEFDLYSKADVEFVLTKEIREYYDNLLDKFFPEDLKWWLWTINLYQVN